MLTTMFLLMGIAAGDPGPLSIDEARRCLGAPACTGATLARARVTFADETLESWVRFHAANVLLRFDDVAARRADLVRFYLIFYSHSVGPGDVRAGFRARLTERALDPAVVARVLRRQREILRADHAPFDDRAWRMAFGADALIEILTPTIAGALADDAADDSEHGILAWDLGLTQITSPELARHFAEAFARLARKGRPDYAAREARRLILSFVANSPEPLWPATIEALATAPTEIYDDWQRSRIYGRVLIQEPTTAASNAIVAAALSVPDRAIIRFTLGHLRGQPVGLELAKMYLHHPYVVQNALEIWPRVLTDVIDRPPRPEAFARPLRDYDFAKNPRLTREILAGTNPVAREYVLTRLRRAEAAPEVESVVTERLARMALNTMGDVAFAESLLRTIRIERDANVIGRVVLRIDELHGSVTRPFERHFLSRVRQRGLRMIDGARASDEVVRRVAALRARPEIDDLLDRVKILATRVDLPAVRDALLKYLELQAEAQLVRSRARFDEVELREILRALARVDAFDAGERARLNAAVGDPGLRRFLLQDYPEILATTDHPLDLAELWSVLAGPARDADSLVHLASAHNARRMLETSCADVARTSVDARADLAALESCRVAAVPTSHGGGMIDGEVAAARDALIKALRAPTEPDHNVVRLPPAPTGPSRAGDAAVVHRLGTDAHVGRLARAFGARVAALAAAGSGPFSDRACRIHDLFRATLDCTIELTTDPRREP